LLGLIFLFYFVILHLTEKAKAKLGRYLNNLLFQELQKGNLDENDEVKQIKNTVIL